MDLSPVFPGSRTALSPSRSLLASATKDRLVLRTADSLQVLHSIRISDAAASLVFSPDSKHLLLVLNNGTTYVYDCDSAEVALSVPPALPGASMSSAWLSDRCVGFPRSRTEPS